MPAVLDALSDGSNQAVSRPMLMRENGSARHDPPHDAEPGGCGLCTCEPRGCHGQHAFGAPGRPSDVWGPWGFRAVAVMSDIGC